MEPTQGWPGVAPNGDSPTWILTLSVVDELDAFLLSTHWMDGFEIGETLGTFCSSGTTVGGLDGNTELIFAGMPANLTSPLSPVVDVSTIKFDYVSNTIIPTPPDTPKIREHLPSPLPLSSDCSRTYTYMNAEQQTLITTWNDQSEQTKCPHPDCGKVFKDLKAHMFTHQEERPKKCPVTTCKYHTKGFARKYDRNRHTLTHYKGAFVCVFCPKGENEQKSFNRADVFKTHLTAMHGVKQTPPNSRRNRGAVDTVEVADTESPQGTGKCNTCSIAFTNAQAFYDHLDDCVLKSVQQHQVSPDSLAHVDIRRLEPEKRNLLATITTTTTTTTMDVAKDKTDATTRGAGSQVKSLGDGVNKRKGRVGTLGRLVSQHRLVGKCESFETNSKLLEVS